ncbi:MAG TPA: ArsR family transcriptional regulator [Gemmataceae bacterium]|jgi:predicted ArsR family transcriptional regulator
MSESAWSKRLLATTRGRVLLLLRRSERTVTELAEALQLTDNAVRAQLAGLERDGLVRLSGSRVGSRKPNLTYEATEDVERLFPKPYGAVLQQLLVVLAERMDEQALEAVLRAVGRRVAAQFRGAVRAPEVAGRVREAVAVLGELGGLAEVEEQPGLVLIRGFDCPLAQAVVGHPCACRLAQELLTDLVGAPVEECCLKGDSPPRCAFRVPIPG